jgi:hypothetical protein
LRFKTPIAVFIVLAAALLQGQLVHAGERGLVDVHIHYSHDAWSVYPPEEAIGILREAGLHKAFVSSSGVGGALKLHALAPELVVPVLRPYRSRGELGTWMHDETVIPYLEERLASGPYRGIGEFHAYGDDADTPIMQEVIRLARENRLFLHAHSDSDAIERILAADPGAVVLWAHSGFAAVSEIRSMLSRYENLRADLAFRSEHASRGSLEPEWRALFEEFPDRFMVGTDTFSPERWYYVREHAAWTRIWLEDLPDDLAQNIAWRNAESLVEAARTRQ